MKEYRCDSCGFVYDPEEGVTKGKYFKDIPENYHCPACNAPKTCFRCLGDECICLKGTGTDKDVEGEAFTDPLVKR